MTTPPPPSDGYYGGEPSEDEKTKAMIAHYGLIAFLCCGIGAIIPALIINLTNNDSQWAKREAAKAFNFGVIPVAAGVAIGIVDFITRQMDIIFVGCLFTLLYLALLATTITFAVMNGIRVGNGEETRYPIEVPILK